MDEKYLAGIFDGEGSTGIYCQGESFHFCLTISQSGFTEPKILTDIHNQYGGHISKNTNTVRSKIKSRKPSWVLSLSRGDEAIKILNDIYPHLKIKNREAKLVIDFIELCKEQRKEKPINKAYPNRLRRSQIEHRAHLYIEFLKVRESQFGGVLSNRDAEYE